MQPCRLYPKPFYHSLYIISTCYTETYVWVAVVYYITDVYSLWTVIKSQMTHSLVTKYCNTNSASCSRHWCNVAPHLCLRIPTLDSWQVRPTIMAAHCIHWTFQHSNAWKYSSMQVYWLDEWLAPLLSCAHSIQLSLCVHAVYVTFSGLSLLVRCYQGILSLQERLHVHNRMPVFLTGCLLPCI